MKLIDGLKNVRWFWLLTAAFLLLAGASPADAARMEVANGDIAGLIAAINAANNEAVNPGEDVIVLATGGSYGLTNAYGDPRNQTGLPAITSDIRIEGHNATIARYPWSGMINMFRFFRVDAGGGLTLDALVLDGGYATSGGAIYNNNYLVLNDVVLRNNRAMSGGGAIYNYNYSWAEVTRGTLQGNLTEGSAGGAIFSRMGYVGLFASALTANQAPMGSGGALYAMRYAQTAIEKCSFDGNLARFAGGAIHNYNNAFLEVSNATLSGNRSESYGGAVANTALLPNLTSDQATAVVAATTLVDNEANIGGMAVYAAGDGDDAVTVRMAGSLVANSHEVVSQCLADGAGARVVADMSSLATDATCDLAYPVAYATLRLGPRALNEGLTKTHALLPGSMAIDWPFTLGVASLPLDDQRGVVRPLDGDGNTFLIADVGAFEHETLINIDIQPKDAANIVKLSRDQVDVLLMKGSPWLEVAALTAGDMVAAKVVFGTNRTVPTVDLTHPVQFVHHLTGDGLLLHFMVAETGLDVADQVACLAVHFTDGRVFRGCDRVTIVP